METTRSRRTARAMFLGSALAVLMAVATAGSASGAQSDGAPGAAPGKDRGGSIHNRTDVWMKDNDLDNGNEPSTGSIYQSPDIKVCHSSAGCASSQNPAVGYTNWIFVTLRRPGPLETSGGEASGSVLLYYVPSGGSATWPADWIYIGSAAASVPLGGTVTVRIPWPSVPGPGHFCLLARWISGTDPMTSAEGPITTINTQNNNNIAWRNVNTVNVIPGGVIAPFPYDISNPLPVAADTSLVFTRPKGRSFADVGGQVVVDLGQTLFERWRRGGLVGNNVRHVGGTQVEIVDPAKASLDKIRLEPRERLTFRIQFSARVASNEQYLVNVAQWGPAAANERPIDLGGVLYQITVSDRQGAK